MTRYICFEGTEGVGKTTQTQKLADHLKSLGYSVLQTKEPGTPLNELTMTLRGIMLDKQYDDQLTIPARELISQAIRSIHLEKVVDKAEGDVDFIIQDRGILSGLAYGEACGNTMSRLNDLTDYVLSPFTCSKLDLYDDIIYLDGNVEKGLQVALNSKQEFEQGDAIEAKGSKFLHRVSGNFKKLTEEYHVSKVINVDGKNIDTVFSEILFALDISKD